MSLPSCEMSGVRAKRIGSWAEPSPPHVATIKPARRKRVGVIIDSDLDGVVNQKKVALGWARLDTRKTTHISAFHIDSSDYQHRAENAKATGSSPRVQLAARSEYALFADCA